MPERVIYRPATAADCAALSELCLLSKAFWGYPPDFLAACRDELTVRPDDLSDMPTQLAAAGPALLGVAQISVDGREAELEKLFVHPDAMGRGIGRRLFSWARDTAREAGAGIMWVGADPGAVAFYEKLGAVAAGTVASVSIPGRSLPLLRLDLT